MNIKIDMMKYKLFVFGLASMLITACGGGEETTGETTTGEDTVAQEVCTYSYDENATVLTWTAFKLTEKVGVNGRFDEINVAANNGSEDMFGTLNGATFSIPVSSLNSQDPVRDPRVKRSFFGNMESTESIQGIVKSINGSSGTVEITMNGKAVEYTGDVSVEEETITLKVTIDITDFEAQIALDSLGVACAEKHTGEDGVNKFWTDVDIAVKTTLVKECK